MEWGSLERSPDTPARRMLLHLDIDAFLASVEQLVEPHLIGRPVVVGTGVVASRSYEAKARGVRTAMRISEARGLCPGLVLREGDAQRAARFRARVGRIVARHIPVVEMTSLDDLYAELGEMVQGGVLRGGLAKGGLAKGGVLPESERDTEAGNPRERALAIAERIRRDVRSETGLSVAQGIGPTRTLARLATSRAKPGGIYCLRQGEERSFLDSFSLAEIPGIGRKTLEALRLFHIERVEDLRCIDYDLLERSFGARGVELYWKLRGMPANEADRRVCPDRSQPGFRLGEANGVWGSGVWGSGVGKQLSRSTSLWEPSADPDFLRGMLSYLVDRASAALRAQKRCCGRLDVFLFFQQEAASEGAFGGAATRRNRSASSARLGRALRPPTACRMALSDLACALLEDLLERRSLVQKLGITLSRFRFDPAYRGGPSTDEDADCVGHVDSVGQADSASLPWVQRELFAGQPTARGGSTVKGAGGRLDPALAEALDRALDRLRERHGFGAVIAGEACSLLGTHAAGREGFRLRTPSLTL